MNGRDGRIQRAPGLSDCAGTEFERIDASIRTVRDVFYGYGYQPIETPLIEQTELFLRRSGGILSSQLFDFVGPDGSEISLRPELTAPVVRHALERVDNVLPMRFQYASPTFRYSARPHDAPAGAPPTKRQFVQVGGELIGASERHADGEIIAIAYSLAKRLGLRDVSVRIGHVGLVREVLGRFNLSERARLFLANSVSVLAKGDDNVSSVESEAMRLGLMPTENHQQIETQASAADLLSRLASGSVRLTEVTESTSRTAEDVVAGLRRKVEWDARNTDFPKALALMCEIAQLRSNGIKPEGRARGDQSRDSCGTKTMRHFDTINDARELTSRFGLNSLDSLENLALVVEAAELGGVDNLDMSVDLGLSASIAYYSGMIFEVNAFAAGQSVTLGGGGRYDGLASALGSEQDLPALGFALNLDTILDLVGIESAPAPLRHYVVLSPMNKDDADEVIETAGQLRSKGHNVVSLFDSSTDAEAIAESVGNAIVMRVGNSDDVKDDDE